MAGIGGTTVESSDVRDEQNQRFIYKAQRFIAEKIRLCAGVETGLGLNESVRELDEEYENIQQLPLPECQCIYTQIKYLVIFFESTYYLLLGW